MDIFSKVGAVVTAGTLIFSDIAFNAQYVSAENEIFPETMIIEDYTGYFQRSFNIDIDGDGEKEKIGYYYIGSEDQYTISDVYYVYDSNSEPYTLYKSISNVHIHYKLHLVKDNNTGETFIGYIYTDMFGSELLYKFNQNGEDEFVTGYRSELNGTIDEGVSLEEYKAYMDNVTFLDHTAYGKGDVDGDADITLSDASMMLSCYAQNAAGLPAEINEIQKNAADMDKDGEITIGDASTALSLYAEYAAGIIDTLILPPTVKEDILGGETLYSGDLESVFYLDIDNDEKKETIGRYDNTNLSSNRLQADPYVLQVYDNGKFYDTFGFDPSGGMNVYTYVLINDRNINETYLASIYHRCAAAYGYAELRIEYPSPTETPMPPYLCVGRDNNNTENSSTIDINGESVTKQELLDYVNNLEIISPYADEADNLSVFEYIFNTYDK